MSFAPDANIQARDIGSVSLVRSLVQIGNDDLLERREQARLPDPLMWLS
jgi:hypothetical protein